MADNRYYYHACRNSMGATSFEDALEDWNDMREQREPDYWHDMYAGFYYQGNYGTTYFVRVDSNGDLIDEEPGHPSGAPFDD